MKINIIDILQQIFHTGFGAAQIYSGLALFAVSELCLGIFTDYPLLTVILPRRFVNMVTLPYTMRYGI